MEIEVIYQFIIQRLFILLCFLSLILFITFILYHKPAPDDQKVVQNTAVTGGKGDTLVVLLHAYTARGDKLGEIREVLDSLDEYSDADFIIPDLPFGLFSMESSSKVTAELVSAIDEAWDNRVQSQNPYKRVLLIGHSIGALYARKLFIVACGENEDARFESDLRTLLADSAYHVDKPRPWAQAVDRIVQLAGMNRGWSISHHMSIPRAIQMEIGVFAGRVFQWVYGRPPIIFTIRRGAPFITQLRLQWLSMKKQAHEKGLSNALTVQLLGSIDDLVSPEDNLDLISGADFIYMDIPMSGHSNVVEMSDPIAGHARREKLVEALEVDGSEKKQQDIADETVSDVVFVIHGIRDEGYWTQKIARKVLELNKNNPNRRIKTETSSYGYFPLLSFLMPGKRQEKVEWFMDRYTEAKARYPEARFHFIGHSHGTYLLAKALQDYDSVRFDQVLFAGSVVHQDYEWEKFIDTSRVKHVYNFEATADWVVAFFPKAIQSIGIQDLGSAGHDGFTVAEQLPGKVKNKSYIIGGHSAAIQEAMWDSIAEFVLTGEFVTPPELLVAEDQEFYVKWPAKISPLIWLVGILLLVCLFNYLLKLDIREWKKTLLLTLYIYGLWIILTRV